MKKKIKGLCLFGYSGSGKSYILNKIYQIIKNSIIIDLDEVEKKFSFDLSHMLNDKITETQRFFGISEILIYIKLFPIVTFSNIRNDIFNLARDY